MSSEQPSADDPIRAVVTRLSRPHHTGGAVIERAAILAEDRESTAILQWITAHAGEPEAAAAAAAPPARGLYGAGIGGGIAASYGPARYVLPPGALRLTR